MTDGGENPETLNGAQHFDEPQNMHSAHLTEQAPLLSPSAVCRASVDPSFYNHYSV